MLRAPITLALALLASAWSAAPAGADGYVDNGAITVLAGRTGTLQAYADDGENAFDYDGGEPAFGLNLATSQGHFGVGAPTAFQFVVEDDVPSHPASDVTTFSSSYSANDPSDAELYRITRKLTLNDGEDAFTVEYTIHNSTTSYLPVTPRLLANLSPRGDTQGIGLPLTSASGDYDLGGRSSDGSALVSVHHGTSAQWTKAEENDFATIVDEAAADHDFTNTSTSSEHDTGIGIQWNALTIPPGGDTTLDAVTVRMVRQLDISPEYGDETVLSAHSTTVTARTTGGQPDPNADIRYQVDGANPVPPTIAGLDPNDAFSYSGANKGIDELTVWNDVDHDGTRDPGEPSRVASVNWHTPPVAPAAPGAIAASLDAPDGLITGASYIAAPPGAQDHGPADTVFGSAFLGFPRTGTTFALLTTGDSDAATRDAASSADAGGGATRGAYDATILKLDVAVPSSASCLSLDFRFLSAESPSIFNDAFVAELDTSDWSVDSDDKLSAPHNFAYDPGGNPITVNATGETEASAANAAGSGYSLGTPVLRASTPVAPGAHSVYLSLLDVGDSIVDSAVLLDHLRTSALTPDQCQPGAVNAGDPIPAPAQPQPQLTPRTPGARVAPAPPAPAPTLELVGTSSDLVGGRHRVRAVAKSDGKPLPSAKVRWAVTGKNPDAGSATANASGEAQIAWDGKKAGTDRVTAYLDLNGNAAHDAREPQEQLVVTWLAPPKLGKTANVEPVSGTVLIKLPRGARASRWKLAPAAAKGFVPLTQAKQIPIGSIVDTQKGRIELQTASSAKKKSKPAHAQFYAGVFKVAQTRSRRRPITELRLNGELDCTSSKKTVAARKRKKKHRSRHLWGSGKGHFRTRGRHSTATVRGTVWYTKDTCTTTTTIVRRGVVTVHDFARHKNVKVKKGHRYVARAKRRK